MHESGWTRRRLAGPRRHCRAEHPGNARVAALAALVGLGLVFTACGGDPASPGVASIGSSTTTTTDTAGGGSSGPNVKAYTQALAYSQCMRAHGVPTFPDPNSNGALAVQKGPGNAQGGVNPNTPKFQSATKSCRHLLPNGGQMTAAQQAQAVAQLLKLVQCMRKHGEPNMPDPLVSSHDVGIRLGNGVDPNSPTFQAAQRACQSLMPGKP